VWRQASPWTSERRWPHDDPADALGTVKNIPLRPVSATPDTQPAASVAAARHAAGSAPWRAARLLTAPHRLGFFAAALLMAASASWWALVLAARHAGVLLPWAVTPMAAHGLTMAFSFMPLFIVGFLFTAGPRWLGLPDVPGPTLLRPVLALAGGWALALPGFHLHAGLAGLGLALTTLGWAAVLHRFVRLLRASRAPDRMHARGIAVAGGVGLLALTLAAVAVASDHVAGARAATQLALWGFLAPTFTIVSHRMLPFFTASALPFVDAWRPNWLLALMVTALGVSALGNSAGMLWAPLPAWAHAALLAVQAPVALLVLWLAVRWGLVQSLRVRLLAMLHGGFVWLGIALALSAGSHALVLGFGPAASLGLAPLHALTMGYLGATLIAMITRVAAGHSGRPLAADDIAWGLYLVLQTAVLLRVAGALWPAAGVALTLLAVLAWAVACCGWALRYGAWLGRPRADGRPG
jgi:uncharacterized protein involved in response to NO